MLAHADGGVEVAEGLQMILDVAPAFVEQVIVDGAFFVDWNQFLEHVLAEFKTFGGNVYHRTAVHFEDVVHGVALGTIGAAGYFDLRKQAILFLIATANLLQERA